MLRILKVQRTQPTNWGLRDTLVLRENNWDDFGYKTTFHLTLFDGDGNPHEIGDVKIGREDQQPGWTSHILPTAIEGHLPAGFFSLGQSAEYYAAVNSDVPANYTIPILTALRDVVADPNLLRLAKTTRVFDVSLLRFTSLTAVEEQFKRILAGGSRLQSFNFIFVRASSAKLSAVNLSFSVTPQSKPPTNVHVLIGRNGVGKTTILNEMASSAVLDQLGDVSGRFFQVAPDGSERWVDRTSNYFSSVTSISFSAFDPFDPPAEQPDKSKGTCYFYVGLKVNKRPPLSQPNERLPKTPEAIRREFVSSLAHCFSLQGKRSQWLRSISILESDPNFAAMELSALADMPSHKVGAAADSLFKLMSSGHAVVLLSITRLIETVDEKALVLIDEPESHLHPPLLAAFTRALSDLLIAKNGVAIVATHSPVVLQEVPRSCAWKLHRSRLQFSEIRPELETFGENVGVLTREVFGLEVSKSGYHALLSSAAESGASFAEIMSDFGNNIGLEGQTLLRALVSARDAEGRE